MNFSHFYTDSPLGDGQALLRLCWISTGAELCWDRFFAPNRCPRYSGKEKAQGTSIPWASFKVSFANRERLLREFHLVDDGRHPVAAGLRMRMPRGSAPL